MVGFSMKNLGGIFLGEGFLKRKSVVIKEKTEVGFSAGTLVIVLTSYYDTLDRKGRGYKRPVSWELAEVINTVKFIEGQGKSMLVRISIWDLPKKQPGVAKPEIVEEWQANDILTAPIPKETESAYRDYCMLMRLGMNNHKTQFTWDKRAVTTVSADMLFVATRDMWMKFVLEK